MDIAFGGTLSLHDFQRAQALDGRSRRLTSLVLGVAGLVLLVQLLPVLAQPLSLAWLIPLLPVLLFALFFWGLLRWQLRRTWQQQQAVFAHVSGVITEAAVTYHTAKSQSTSQWDLFQRYRLAPDMVLLYQTTQAVNVFPRHFFASEAEWRAFTQLVEAKLGHRR